MHSAYEKAVQSALKQIHYEGELPSPDAQDTVISVNEGNIVLRCLLNPEHEVKIAKHSGASGELRGLLDLLCDVLQGRNLQEGADHGVIRLESRMRDSSVSSPVSGLLTPDNADVLFKLPLTLVRRLYDEYLKTTNGKENRNFWKDKVTPAWAVLSDDARTSIVRSSLLQICRELGLQDRGIEIIDIKHDTRVTIDFEQDSSKPDFARNMIKVEILLRARLEPQLELLLESLEDKNKRKGRTVCSS